MFLPTEEEVADILDKNFYTLRDKITNDGTCYRCYSRLFNQSFVCKVFTNTFSFNEELDILSKIEHPNLAKIVQFFNDYDKYYVIMEDCVHGNIKNYLEETNTTSAERLGFCTDLIRVVNFLHSKGITHRNIKPENVLIDKSGKLKLSDIGFLQYNVDSCKPNSKYYLSPEVLADGLVNQYKSDMWSLGITLYYIIYMDLPFKDAESWNTFLQTGITQVPTFISEEFQQILKMCMQPQPEKRTLITEIFKLINKGNVAAGAYVGARKRNLPKLNKSKEQHKSHVFQAGYLLRQMSLSKNMSTARSNASIKLI